MPVEQLFPAEDQALSYPGSINVELAHPGRVGPTFDHAALSGSADVLHYFGSQFVETLDENNLPVVFAFANKTVYKIQNGTISVDNTFSSGGVIQDLCIVSMTNSNPSPGTEHRALVAVFGTGGPTGTAGNAVRNMATNSPIAATAAGVWTNQTGASYLTAYFLRKNADQLAAATGTSSTGRAATVERKIAICTVGSDPTLVASWSTAQAVSNDPTWQINNIAVFEDRFCVGMPQGFFIRDQQEGRWKNMTPHVIPHGVNGKVTVSGENGVWYATKKELFFFDGRQMHDKTPFAGMEKPRDMPQGRVSALVDGGDRVLAVLECWDDLLEGKQAGDAGLRIFREDAGVITELTANATDGSMATLADMAGWGDTTDYLVFGFPRKLAVLGTRTLTTAAANTATQSFTSPQALNGSGTWTSLGSIRDATILSTAGKSLQVTGFPASAGESIIGWTNIDAYDTAGLDTYNSISNYYWYRVTKATAAAMSAGSGFHEAFVVPARPGLPHEGLLSASTNFTSLMRAGGVTRVLEMTRERGKEIWQDRYHVVTGGGVFCIGWTQSPFAGGSNGGPGFLLLGRFGQFQVMEGRSHDATEQKFPRLCQITTSEPGPMLAVYNVMLGDPRRLTRLMKVWATGVFVQPTDACQLFVQVDEWKVYNLGTRYGSHAMWEIDPTQFGTFWRGHFFLVMKDTAQPAVATPDPQGPYWTHLIAEYEDAGVEYEVFQQAPFPSGAEVV